MPLHHTLAFEPPALRRWRWCAPLLLAVGLAALALTPGAISGDQPFQINLCGDHEEGLDACAQLLRSAVGDRTLVR